MPLKIIAAFCFVLALSIDVRAELVIFCGRPAPDHRECCPIVLDLYIKYPPNPRSANDRQNQALLADWLNNNCAPPNRKRR